MRFFYLLAAIAFLVSCKNSENSSDTNSEKVLLSVHLDKAHDSIVIRRDSRYKMANQKDTSLTLFSKNNSFSDTLNIPEGYYELKFKDHSIKLFLQPGFQLNISQNGPVINFTGKGADENQYLQKRGQMLADLGGKNYPRSYYLKLKENDFLKFVDSIEKSRMKLISSSNLDETFRKRETNREQIEKADKINTYSFGRKFIDSSYVVSNDYPDPLKNLDIIDPSLLNIDLYRILLFTYSGPKSEDLNMERWEYILSDEFPSKNEEIRQEVFYITAVFDMAGFKKLDEFYADAQKFVENRKYMDEITKKYLDLKNLAKGKQAPEFELDSLEGNTVALEDLKGNVVFLDIWTTSCGPCIQAMPEIKKLQDDFEDQNIKFVSIGVESKKERVQEILRMKNLGGIQLFHPSKDEEIMKKYAVTSFPRYVLIDEEGKIVEHKADHPTDPGLKKQLNTLLK
ncbi:MAG TPA: TlpA disulfide reductase family protein [Christiangramia sp.]|nr:TlpA disulfide reductase family protein [Christiangramia sp.]